MIRRTVRYRTLLILGLCTPLQAAGRQSDQSIPTSDTAVIRIDISPRLRADVDDKEAFFRVVRAGFGTRRKQLRNSLAGGLRIPPATATELIAEADLDGTQRPQELSLDAWAALSRAWQDRGSPEDVA